MDEDTSEQVLEALMERLEGADASEPEFMTTLGEMRRAFEHHITDEEGRQCPEMRRHVPQDRLVQLMGRAT